MSLVLVVLPFFLPSSFLHWPSSVHSEGSPVSLLRVHGDADPEDRERERKRRRKGREPVRREA